MRRLSPEEQALWRKVVETVRPMEGKAPPSQSTSPLPTKTVAKPLAPRAAAKPVAAKKAPGVTLDASWDRRLARGLVQPDRTVDLHGHNLATAYALIDERLGAAIAAGDRLVLLITGKAPSPQRPAPRGAIRAAVGDWLAASRHASDIAAVRNAAPRHGGAGALYIVLRRRRSPSLQGRG